jgi:hypothetical protein
VTDIQLVHEGVDDLVGREGGGHAAGVAGVELAAVNERALVRLRVRVR